MFFTGKYEQLYLVAVMAEYIKQEMCDLNGTGEKPVYYRMKIQRNMDMEDFVERITYPGSGLSRGSVIQVMTTVAEHLAYCMAEGQSVTLDGIGTFTPRLGVAKDKEIDSLEKSKVEQTKYYNYDEMFRSWLLAALLLFGLEIALRGTLYKGIV